MELFIFQHKGYQHAPSKLWFLIMAGKSKFETGADGLGLGILLFWNNNAANRFLHAHFRNIKDWKLK